MACCVVVLFVLFVRLVCCLTVLGLVVVVVFLVCLFVWCLLVAVSHYIYRCTYVSVYGFVLCMNVCCLCCLCRLLFGIVFVCACRVWW